MPHFEFGPSLLEHLLLKSGFTQNTKVKDFPLEATERLSSALTGASDFVKAELKSGIIVQKSEKRPRQDGSEEEFHTHLEFHPYLFQQYQEKTVLRSDLML